MFRKRSVPLPLTTTITTATTTITIIIITIIITVRVKERNNATYIDKARKAGYAVMILRPNTNSATITGNANNANSDSGGGAEKKVLIKGSESPEIHALYVWENFICKCDNIKMVSLLGINTTNTATIATAIAATSTTTVSTTIVITNPNTNTICKDTVMALVCVRILL